MTACGGASPSRRTGQPRMTLRIGRETVRATAGRISPCRACHIKTYCRAKQKARTLKMTCTRFSASPGALGVKKNRVEYRKN